ncbi:MAG TPA: 2-hydroxychromene-2-carboxylate isomerase [Geminicoccaceae bacterium]|nr:2-hydroxychromene-2-carboxylate isomerase [Geminicoccaceae bacterium]
MADPIDFYFEFASPYGYLASTQIDRVAERYGRTVAWHPIMLGAAFKETGAKPLTETPLKGPYLLHDVPRFARLLGVPLTLPPVMPMNSLAASRACLWLDETDAALAKRLAQTLLHAHWGEGRDLSPPETVAEVAAGLGIDRDALLAAVADQRIKDRLKAQTQAAIERGVFGSPFIFIDGEPFWGADRLSQIEAWLARGGW